ncbi:hypothetical protein [Okeania sp. SIO1I7]|uniref:hypothetical protein n=1 Tax=Okeania sp. SIO1I7 TaxID=2607772 RepID=UPI0013FA6C96|nr:hypothetical protein [Okeania sp. SIO1I7]NET25479.1 hypothetical protein [Okeania sp. SIO1I7]
MSNREEGKKALNTSFIYISREHLALALDLFPITPSPHHPITPSPHHPITPSPHHPITPSPHHPITPSPHHPITLLN